MTLKYLTAGSLTVALDLDRAEVPQTIVELATWVTLSPASATVNSTAADGSSAVTSVLSMARVTDSAGVAHTLDKTEARELCSKAAVEMFAVPV